MTTTRLQRPFVLAAALLCACVADRVVATQHLVSPGDRWQQLEEKLKPGDEVIFMPGRHRAARLGRIVGTAEQPIVFRSADPQAPALIQAERFGIEIRQPRHVRLQNLTITGATIAGLALRDDPGDESAAIETEEDLIAGEVVIENVSILETGPKGERHAILVDGLERVRIIDCVVSGWAGSGLEITACRQVEVTGCQFIGREGYGQMSGIRVRGGSDRVRIDECRLEQPGDQGICIGGVTKLDEFIIDVPDDAKPGSLFEASRVQVTRTVIERGQCAVAFVNCERSAVNNCTLLAQNRAVVSLRQDQTDPRFGAVSNCTFGSNLIVWEPGGLTVLGHYGPDATGESFYLGENLWWAADFPGDQDLGGFPGVDQHGQITGVDPKLDEGLRPTVVAAELFGAHAP